MRPDFTQDPPECWPSWCGMRIAVTITKGDKSIDAGRLIAVMGLGIHQGDEVIVSADDEEVLAKLKYFFETYL